MPASKGENCVSEEMHRWKHTGLHSGTGKKGKKGKLVKYPSGQEQAIAIALNVCGKSNHSEAIQALGFSEEAAELFAEMYDFISAKETAGAASDGPLGDIDSKPGKQKGNSGRKKESQQGSVAQFPTSKIQPSAPGLNEYDEGPMIRAKGGKCPPGARSTGGGFCKNPKAGKRQYFEIEKGKSCPPGSRTAGKGRCRVDFAEAREVEGQCNQEQIKKQNQARRTPEERQADQQRAREMQGQTPDVPSGVRQEAAKKAAETRKKCSKNKDNTAKNNAVTTPSNNATSTPGFKEMHQSIEEKRHKIKELQREGHPASILIKQVKDHG